MKAFTYRGYLVSIKVSDNVAYATFSRLDEKSMREEGYTGWVPDECSAHQDQIVAHVCRTLDDYEKLKIHWLNEVDLASSNIGQRQYPPAG